MPGFKFDFLGILNFKDIFGDGSATAAQRGGEPNERGKESGGFFHHEENNYLRPRFCLLSFSMEILSPKLSFENRLLFGDDLGLGVVRVPVCRRWK